MDHFDDKSEEDQRSPAMLALWQEGEPLCLPPLWGWKKTPEMTTGQSQAHENTKEDQVNGGKLSAGRSNVTGSARASGKSGRSHVAGSARPSGKVGRSRVTGSVRTTGKTDSFDVTRTTAGKAGHYAVSRSDRDTGTIRSSDVIRSAKSTGRTRSVTDTRKTIPSDVNGSARDTGTTRPSGVTGSTRDTGTTRPSGVTGSTRDTGTTRQSGVTGHTIDTGRTRPSDVIGSTRNNGRARPHDVTGYLRATDRICPSRVITGSTIPTGQDGPCGVNRVGTAVNGRYGPRDRPKAATIQAESMATGLAGPRPTTGRHAKKKCDPHAPWMDPDEWSPTQGRKHLV